MDAAQFRAAGHELVEWCARYLESTEGADLAAGPAVEPGWVRAQLPLGPPAAADAWDDVLADLDRVVLPGAVHWQSPRFLGYFPCNSWLAVVLGRLAFAALGQQGMLWATSPVTTELEQHTCDWLVELLDLPRTWRHDTGPGGGVILDAASSATFTAAVAARDAAGAPLEDLVAYASADAHSSVEKAIRLAGLAPTQLRAVPVDVGRRLRVDALTAMVEEDLAAGRRPFLVVTTIGTTSFMAVDPVAGVGAVARAHGLWHHVDAAMAGTAALSPAVRPLVNPGLDAVDSYCFDPHKWLGAGMDCDVLFVADREPLVRAMSVVPEYLRNPRSDSGAVVDYRDWGVPLGRRFRALKLWFLLRLEGADGLRAMVERHCDLARTLAAAVDADPVLDLVVPCEGLPLVCIAHRDGDAATQRLLDAVNGAGFVATHTRLAPSDGGGGSGRLVLRVSTAGRLFEQRHLDDLWAVLQA